MSSGEIMTPDQEYKRGVRAAVGIAVLCALCVLVSLSGLRSSSVQHSELSSCLTAAKIGEWQRAVYGWGMDRSASKPCQVASAEASAYLAKSNTDLLGTGKLTELDSDSQAKELINSAALACGRRVP